MTGRPFLLGLTGSMAMGKSTAAAMFGELGIPIWDADEAVARLYDPGGAAVEKLVDLFGPAILGADGGIDRSILKSRVVDNRDVLMEVESAVHPLVEKDRQQFARQAEESGKELAVLEIPLLFEKGFEREVDAVAVVTAPEEVQIERLQARGKMSKPEIRAMLARQLPDSEKRRRADYIICSSSIAAARAGVKEVLKSIETRGSSDAGSRS